MLKVTADWRGKKVQVGAGERVGSKKSPIPNPTCIQELILASCITMRLMYDEASGYLNSSIIRLLEGKRPTEHGEKGKSPATIICSSL